MSLPHTIPVRLCREELFAWRQKKSEGLIFDCQKCYDSLATRGRGLFGSLPQALHCMRVIPTVAVVTAPLA